MRTPLDQADLMLVRQLQREVGAGDHIRAARWEELRQYQPFFAERLAVPSPESNTSAWETLSLVRDQSLLATNPDMQEFGYVARLDGPRWWFHLLGLRHASVHVTLTTPQGWFIAQRRSFAKDESPGALDVAVSGHIGTANPLDAARREMAEEIGLQTDATVLVENRLTFLTSFMVDILDRAEQNPPFVNREMVIVYNGQLTEAGMSQLRFSDGEVTALMLLGAGDIQRLAERCARNERHTAGEIDIAEGLLHTLPRWLAYQRLAG